MCTDRTEVLETQVAELQKKIDELKRRTQPDEIAKSIDNSYLSVANLRAFLQILSLILTIFLAGALYFGYIGLTNILKIREEANQTESIRKSTELILRRVSKIEGQIGAKVARVDQAIPDLETKTNTEISKLQRKVDQKVEEVDIQVKEIASDLKNISEIFNKIGVSKEELLNAREQQMLLFLAKEIDPTNPTFNFNAAHSALAFRRYDECLQYLNVVLKSEDIQSDIRKRAEDLKAQATKLKANPPQLEYKEVEGPSVGPYGIFEFPLNILDALVRNGYLTVGQAQEILDASKRK